jgi:hypothetical protein
MTTSADVQPAHEPYLTFARFSELVVLARPSHPSLLAQDTVAEELLRRLAGLMRTRFGIPLHDDPFRRTGGTRAPAIVGPPDRPLLLQTFNLQNWVTEEQYVDHVRQPLSREESEAWHRRRIVDVFDAMRAFREHARRVERDLAEPLWPVAVSPNWLAVSFCG